MWSTYIMDLLLVLASYGNEYDPFSPVAQFDFNNDGVIGMYDFLEMLAQQPPL